MFSREYNRSMRWAETYFRKHMPMEKDANALDRKVRKVREELLQKEGRYPLSLQSEKHLEPGKGI